MPNSLPYAVFHFKNFVVNLAYYSFCAPKSWEEINSRSFPRDFHRNWSQKSHICLKGSLLSLAGEAIMEISSDLHHRLWARAVKNPSGTVDQNYLKSTEKREGGLGLMWSQSLQLRSIPQTLIIFPKPGG